MKSTMKRIMSMTTVGALAVAMTAPAFAAAPSTTITAKYAEIAIAVTVPTKLNAQINPYGLPVELKADADATTPDGTISGLRIVSDPAAMINNTKVGLDVGATVTVTEVGNLKVSEAAASTGALTAIDQTTKGNTAIAFIEAQSDKSGTLISAIDADTGTIKQASLNAAFDKVKWPNTMGEGTNAGELTIPDTAYIGASKAGNKIVANADDASLPNCLIQLAGIGSDGKVAKGGIALFRLNGDVVKNPDTAWAKTDGMTVAVAWTFTPTVSST